jgi:hypothetical protein
MHCNKELQLSIMATLTLRGTYWNIQVFVRVSNIKNIYKVLLDKDEICNLYFYRFTLQKISQQNKLLTTLRGLT